MQQFYDALTKIVSYHFMSVIKAMEPKVTTSDYHRINISNMWKVPALACDSRFTAHKVWKHTFKTWLVLNQIQWLIYLVFLEHSHVCPSYVEYTDLLNLLHAKSCRQIHNSDDKLEITTATKTGVSPHLSRDINLYYLDCKTAL